MPETPKKVMLAKGYEIATIRHVKYNSSTKQLEVICFVRNDDVRARFVTGNGRTSAAYLKVEPSEFEQFLAEVFAAFPADLFEPSETGTIKNYRRPIPSAETAYQSGKPRRSKKGFGLRYRFPNDP
jgi:hypothetical protein